MAGRLQVTATFPWCTKWGHTTKRVDPLVVMRSRNLDHDDHLNAHPSSPGLWLRSLAPTQRLWNHFYFPSLDIL